LGRRRGQKEQKWFEVWTKIQNQAPGAAPAFAVWELEDFAVRNGRIYGRACDDLIGVAAILAVMIELKRTRAAVKVIGLISRAEEVGLHGALGAAASGGVPAGALVISLETSRELPGVRMGEGVILRVGDRTSIFDPAATRFLMEVARDLKRIRKDFTFQRALMSGGTCEATAYQEFGFQTAALCVALGNYHNCAPGNRIRPEHVSARDACGMVDLLLEAARQLRHYRAITGRLAKRLKRLLAEGRKKLMA
jgi:endoglucanase